MLCLEKLEWHHPLTLAAQVPKNEDDWVLLYSGMEIGNTGRYSLLALNKQEEVTDEFNSLEKKLSSNESLFDSAWFGYLGYGLKNQIEKLATDEPSFINTPDLWLARFGVILVFDHKEKWVEVYANSHSLWEGVKFKLLNNATTQESGKANTLAEHNNPLPEGEGINISSNMTRFEYLEKVDYIKEAIKRGDLYQANLTRKFFGEIVGKVNPFDIFKKLCKISPAPYSAFIKFGDLTIISSSPERFLYIDKNGNANTRPIKGSSARNTDAKMDENAITALQNSEKDRAENLMIVDLSRNDLARNCDSGTVKVDELFKIETYATVHHMVSSINGIKKKTSSTLDLIKGCFPPGSMTGTPKIKAMEICSKLEELKRGIYGGAIGWFGGDGSADLSVVIRTIILKGNKFEFQVGGAIVNDSVANSEFKETMLKAKGVAGALGIEISNLEKI